MTRTDRVRGCLLGGAVGDALGAPVEFLSLPQIRQRFGPEGITDFVPEYGRAGAITDDTQMTLFSAEGLLRAVVRGSVKGICHGPSVLHHAYVRWLHTQGETSASHWRPPFDGWLIGVRELYDRRAPGMTCLSALRAAEPGTIERPINNSKGCGTVMRSAPFGFLGDETFVIAAECAALTHGHPSGYLSAGALALIIRLVSEGASLESALEESLRELAKHQGHEETTRALRRAIDAASHGSPSAEAVEKIGAGWVAEEALAIAVYASLCAGPDFARGVRLAVNHTGDSDSTGAIAGNILGALLGSDAIPAQWLDQLELRTEITSLADDVVTEFRDDEAWWNRYPGW